MHHAVPLPASASATAASASSRVISPAEHRGRERFATNAAEHDGDGDRLRQGGEIRSEVLGHLDYRRTCRDFLYLSPNPGTEHGLEFGDLLWRDVELGGQLAQLCVIGAHVFTPSKAVSSALKAARTAGTQSVLDPTAEAAFVSAVAKNVPRLGKTLRYLQDRCALQLFDILGDALEAVIGVGRAFVIILALGRVFHYLEHRHDPSMNRRSSAGEMQSIPPGIPAGRSLCGSSDLQEITKSNANSPRAEPANESRVVPANTVFRDPKDPRSFGERDDAGTFHGGKRRRIWARRAVRRESLASGNAGIGKMRHGVRLSAR